MEPTGPNLEQIRYWNESSAQTWLAQEARLDEQLAPYSARTISALPLAEGMRVLDIGCGCGATTLALAARVGATGAVLGVDVSAPMLQRARERAATGKLEQVRFENADAQTYPFPADSADAVFSRFGVMFFADPSAAFANIRRAVRSGGRLGFVCWQAMSQNPWMAVPLMAAAQHLTLPAPSTPDAPGPFAFARPERVRAILEDAGWSDVDLVPFEPSFRISNSQDLEEAVAFMMQLGPLAAVMRDADPTLLPRVRQAVREALLPFHGPDGVQMGSATWIVTAANP